MRAAVLEILFQEKWNGISNLIVTRREIYTESQEWRNIVAIPVNKTCVGNMIVWKQVQETHTCIMAYNTKLGKHFQIFDSI